ncbi:ankyrin repeat domain-containing protein 27 isoform X2 [Cryptotermes secundus]|uniref:ankyrin repeat domain-containing protein 27 isoform X2 n=1 Tax=Cryptotermes secundus TaxID=105785 RepID=UPI000CD7DB9A|nr:ankyrin repeat domain-containing protein 27 isoform X2 [Cryptotermes secundus]
MATDEIEYNAYYHTLQNKFRRKYEQALSRCWMICVPCSRALRGLNITEEFVELHILRPSPSFSSHYASTDEGSSHIFELNGDSLILHKAPVQIAEKYAVKILSVESGYNKEYQQYKILITDKPLSPKYQSQPVEDDGIQLRKINSLADAVGFLTHFPVHIEVLIKLGPELQQLCSSLLSDSLQVVREKVHDTMSCYWMTLLKTHPLDRQRDAHFQNLLSISLENFIMSRLHDLVFQMVCNKHNEDDAQILGLVKELASAGVTADQLGAPEDFAIPLPAAVVELASLDSLNCPVDKLSCLRTTLDLILAELKGAIVDAHSVLSKDSQMPTLMTDDLIPLLVTVIIQAKPLHMASNLYYMENFQWTLSPSDATSFSLVTFKAAIQELLTLKPKELRPRSEKVRRELRLEDLMKVTVEVGQRFERSGERREEIPISPLDRQMERITAMIEASTQDLNDETLHLTEDVDQNKHVTGSLHPFVL